MGYSLCEVAYFCPQFIPNFPKKIPYFLRFCVGYIGIYMVKNRQPKIAVSVEITGLSLQVKSPEQLVFRTLSVVILPGIEPGLPP